MLPHRRLKPQSASDELVVLTHPVHKYVPHLLTVDLEICSGERHVFGKPLGNGGDVIRFVAGRLLLIDEGDDGRDLADHLLVLFLHIVNIQETNRDAVSLCEILNLRLNSLAGSAPRRTDVQNVMAHDSVSTVRHQI